MKLVGNFARHLRLKHNNEEEVVHYNNILSRSEKLAYVKAIMTAGDALCNTQNPKNLTVGRLSKKISYDRTTCPKCKLLISDKHAVAHLRKCNPEYKYTTGSAIRAQINRERLHFHVTLSEDMKTRIIPYMRKDSVRTLCETDSTLIMYGNKMCVGLKGEGQEKTIRNHMRILGRVTLKTMEKSEGTITCASELFQPKHYNAFVNAICHISRYGQAEGEEMAKPSTPHQYGPKIKGLSDKLLTELLKKIDPEKENDEEQTELKKQIKTIEAWQAVYKRDFDKQIASLGRKQAERRTFESRQLTPSMKDVQTLLRLLEEKLNEAASNLKNRFSYDDYINLCKRLLLKLWIFNRRRVGDVDDLLIKNWLNAKEVDEASDQYLSLTQTEQRFASSFKRVLVRAKGRRPATLLVAKKDLQYYELMISLRDVAKIPKDNIYLFAIHDRYIEGTATMHKFAKESGAKNW